MTHDKLLSVSFQGAVQYRHTYPDENHARIVISARFEDADFIIPVIVDTAAPWCILDPQLAEEIGIDYRAEYELEVPLNIRGNAYYGWLCTIPITLDAEDGYGMGIEVEAKVFIPRLNPGEDKWPYPDFLGLDGFLSRIRFAVDPEAILFYFAALGEQT
jgi:hypothetical protein